jgi:hypothetical protein
MLDEKVKRYQEALHRALNNLGAQNSAEREVGYEKLRKASDTLLDKNLRAFGPEVVAQLHETLEAMISNHRHHSEESGRETSPPVATEAPRAKPIGAGLPHQKVRGRGSFDLRNHLIVGVMGALLSAAVVLSSLITLSATGLISISLTAEGHTATETALKASYEAHLPQVEVAAAFLERLRNEVIARQQNDAAGLSALAGNKFVKLKAVMPELAAQLPKTLPKGSAVILRADAAGYKILLNWPLCATVQYAKPELVDPVRARNVFGCSHFGLWNEAGAKW